VFIAGLLEVDDLDAALDLLADRQPPPLHRSIRARLALAARRACGLTVPPPVPAAELRSRAFGLKGWRLLSLGAAGEPRPTKFSELRDNLPGSSTWG
jgi:hypothetical protein